MASNAIFPSRINHIKIFFYIFVLSYLQKHMCHLKMIHIFVREGRGFVGGHLLFSNILCGVLSFYQNHLGWVGVSIFVKLWGKVLVMGSSNLGLWAKIS